MLIGSTTIGNFSHRLPFKGFQTFLQPQARNHDFTHCKNEKDYAFEFIENEQTGYMTAQRSGIQTGDYITLKIGSHFIQYEVETLSYYADPPDLWMASLKQVTD
jgi:MioC protein